MGNAQDDPQLLHAPHEFARALPVELFEAANGVDEAVSAVTGGVDAVAYGYIPHRFHGYPGDAVASEIVSGAPDSRLFPRYFVSYRGVLDRS